MSKPTDFEFGHDESPQGDLFGGSLLEDPMAPPSEGGAAPTLPLQISAKEIRIERITMAQADAYSIKYHYLHRTAKNSKIAFGIFAKGELHGIMIWGMPVAPMKGQKGLNFNQLELRRMFCDGHLPKNSESRCLAIATRILHNLFPNVRKLVAYSDLSQGHRGGIYKAAGWIFDGRIVADKDGGWSKHPRHNRVEFGDKFKWIKPLREEK